MNKLIKIVIITLLLAALGLFVYAVVTQRFELRRKAVSGEPTPATATPTPTPTATPNPDICVRRTQIINLTPSTQSDYRGNSLAYTLTVKNDDSSECGTSTFNFSTILPYSNWAATFSSSSRVINPGDTSTVTVNFVSSANSPFGTLPVGVNVAGPKFAIVAAANYQILQPTSAPTAKATAKPTPEVVYVPGSTATSSASPSASPTELPVVADDAGEAEPAGILSNIPTAVIYGVGGFLLIILFFILRALFSGGKDNNPPKITPPVAPTPPTPMPQAPVPQPQPVNTMNPPIISHSVEAPINQ